MRNCLKVLLASSALAAATAMAQVVVMQPLTTFGTNGDGTVRPNEVPALTTTNQLQRGIAYNPATGHLLVVDRSSYSGPNNDVHILDGQTGAHLGILENGSTLAGGTAGFTLSLIGVADDGAIYVANLTSSTAGAPQSRLYRWANESAFQTLISPTFQFPTDDPSSGNTNSNQKRWGDTMTVRGSGLNTQILLANRGTLAVLYTPDNATYEHFTPHTLSTDIPVGGLGYGLTFGPGNTFWGTSGPNGNGPLLHLSFDLGSGTATTIESLPSPAFPGTIAPMLFMPAQNLLAGITMVPGPDVVRLYDFSNPGVPVLLDRKPFITANANNNFAGSLTLGTNGVLYALDSDNGIGAFTLTTAASNPLPPAFFLNPAADLVVAGATATLNAAADSSEPVSYQWRFFGTNILAGATNASLVLTNIQGTSAGSYSVVASNSLGSVTSAVAVLTVVITPPTTLLVYDPFPYAPGSSVAGQGSWFSTATVGTADTGNLDIPGLAPSLSNRLTWSGATMSLRLTNGVTTLSGPIYFSFAYKLDTASSVPSAGSTVAGFAIDNTSTTFGTKINVRTNAGAASSYNIGVFKGGGETAGGYATSNLSLGDTVFIVGRYVFGDGSGDDTCAMWINPDPATFGTSNAPAATVGDIGVGTADMSQITRFFFRSSGGPSRSYADEVRVGLTWADVTPKAIVDVRLSIVHNGDSTVTIAFPTTASGFVLESASDLTSPVTWTAVTTPVIVVGTNQTVTLNAAGNQFFRLKK